VELSQQLRVGHTMVAKLHLQFDRCHVRVESNSQALIDALTEYYLEFQSEPVADPIVVIAIHGEPPALELPLTEKAPDPGKARPKEAFADLPDGRVVHKIRTGMWFVMAGPHNVAIGDTLTNESQIINFVNNRYIEWQLHRGALLAHAAAVALNDSAVAIAGFSGMGKSTLSLHMMLDGLTFISNDRVLLSSSPNSERIWGVPKHPRINPGTALNNPRLVNVMTPEERERFSKLATDELWALEHKFDGIVHECFGPGRFAMTAKLAAFVILNWKHGAGPAEVRRVEIAERRDLLQALMKSPGLFFEPEDEAEHQALLDEDSYIRALGDTPVYEVVGGVDFTAAREALVALLRDAAAADGAPPERRQRVTITRDVVLPDPTRIARYERAPELGPRVLFFSGGTALRRVSQELVRYTHQSIHLITPFDSGGSSATIRSAFQMLSVGDLRNRLMALADTTIHGHPAVYRLFGYRFPKASEQSALRERLRRMVEGEDLLVTAIPRPLRRLISQSLRTFLDHMPPSFDLRGASVGNLILAGGYLANGRDIDAVIFLFSKLVEVRGLVRPLVDADVHLAAHLADGRVVVGQHNLTGKESAPIDSPVRELRLSRVLGGEQPAEVAIDERTHELIANSELIVFPIGSFYSSVMANLVPQGVGRAVRDAGCPKIYVPNSGVDPEQLELAPADAVVALLDQLRRDAGRDTPTDRLLNVVLVDSARGDYRGGLDIPRIEALGVTVIDVPLVTDATAPLLAADRLVKALLSFV
jgi:CofD-related protein of GAK system/HprK-related kinase B